MSSVTERAVIYVDSGSDLSSMTSISSSSSSSLSSPRRSPSTERPIKPSQSNYVIKIQIGEERMFNTPVRIDVAAGKKHTQSRIRCGQESPLNSSGQSSPCSDMTPPPLPRSKIGGGGPIRFGSETSESDTESDVSSADYHSRPSSLRGLQPTCSAAQFAMREILELGGPPSLFNLDERNNGRNRKSTGAGKEKHIIIQNQDIPREFASLKNSVNQSLIHCFSQGKPRLGNGTSIKQQQMMSNHSIQYPAVIVKMKQSGGYEQKRPNRFRLSETGGGGSEDSLTTTEAAIPERYVANIIVDEALFHLNEINECNGSATNGISVNSENTDSLSNFVGYKDIFARSHREGPTQIMSDKGTIRGVKNRVRDGIATFLQSKDSKNYNEKEQGRVVVYVTSMGVVRDTFQRCQKVKQILRTLLVKFDERDCYMNRAVQDEIRDRLPPPSTSSKESTPAAGQPPSNINNPSVSINLISLPQVFLEGQHLGDADTIEKLNETGQLRNLLRPYKSLSVLSTCDRCGGFRMLPCPVCNGSKKSVHRNHFTTEFVALKCMHCDSAGLIRCDLCNAATT